MSGKNESVVPGQGVDWRLSFRSVCVHNDHLQMGRKESKGCSVCIQGLGGVMARIEVVEKPDKKDEVVEGDGVDDKSDTPPSFSDWADFYGKND